MDSFSAFEISSFELEEQRIVTADRHLYISGLRKHLGQEIQPVDSDSPMSGYGSVCLIA